MNSEQDALLSLLAQQQKQQEHLGTAQLRRSALKRLRLKTVIKESHCSAVQALAFNSADAAARNLFATVGKDQATIYDDQHMADFTAVVASLSLSTSLDAAQDSLCACAWVNSTGLTRHPYGDALLAVGGADPHVHIISTAAAAVVAQLPVPAGTSVVELSAAGDCPGLLLVLCKDGTLQLWQLSSGQCLWSTRSDAFTAALHPQGLCIVSSSRSAKLSSWDLQALPLTAASAAAGGSGSGAAAAAAEAAAASVAKQPLALEGGMDAAVDCIRFLPGDRLAVKAVDGRMAVHAFRSGKQLSSWRVPGYGNSPGGPSHTSRCCFGHTADGQLICAGNPAAAAYVYEAATGSQLVRVEAIRVQGPVRACGLSEDCRHLLLVAGAGFVFRYEHRPTQEEVAAQQQERDDDAAAVADRGVQAAGSGAVAAAAASDDDEQDEEEEEEDGSGDAVMADASEQPAAAAASPALPGCELTPGVGVGAAAPWQLGGSLEGRSGSLGALMMGAPGDEEEGQDADLGAARQLWGSGGAPAASRLATAAQHAADDSPLMFRPTPRKG